MIMIIFIHTTLRRDRQTKKRGKTIQSIQHFFSVRVILIWNRLPVALVQEKNLSVFKSMLRTFDFSYTLPGKL